MPRRFLALAFPLVAAATFSCHQGASRPAVAPPPSEASLAAAAKLTANKEEPLLLEEGSAPTEAAGGADNSRCQVCHLNLVQEPLARTHARAGLGCARCHGASDAHIADESWASGGNGTAPDIMFPKAAVNPACLGCHPQDKIRPDHHADFLAGKVQYCTDCHGQHRLLSRKCHWK